MVHLSRLAEYMPVITALLPATWAQVSCSGSFNKVTASDFVHSLNPGWNIGNTLDAVQNEGDWGPALQYSTLKNVQAAGYKGIRIPVTWAYHFASESPTWDVNSTWMDRVEEVVDWVLGLGFHAIINAHHDSWSWADLTASGANYTMIEEKFYRLWYQIGVRLACKSSALAFEPLNEPTGSTADHAAELNKLNGIFLQAITDAGGFNSERVVTLVGLNEDSVKTSQWFKAPENIQNPWALQYHYYSPYDFVFNAWGKTIWGSDADKAALENDLALIRGNFTNIPLLIGEWSPGLVSTDNASRWKYLDFLVRTAASYDTVTMLWDWSYNYAASSRWIDPTAQDLLMNAAAGTVNSLPDIKDDTAARTQTSSAYIYHKVGEAATEKTISLVLNGNTLRSVSSSVKASLANGADYRVSGGDVTFTTSFLSTVFSSTTTGSHANITLHLSRGADLVIEAFQWDTPKLSVTSATASSLGSSDYSIPIAWAGQSRVATARATKADGTFLEDDWTQWLGSLQSGRLVYNNHFSYDASNVIIRSAVIRDTITAAQPVTIMFEFFPRQPDNTANFTLTI